MSVLLGVIASSGFWAYLTNKKDRKSMQTELLIGLAHDRLVSLSLQYISRGWITQDEYENLNVYLYKPYVGVGGNGSVKRLMLEVDKLPIRKEKIFDKVTGDTVP
jgi:hypothetical protein